MCNEQVMLFNIFRIMVWVKRAFIIKSFLIHEGFSIHQLSFYTQAVLYITYSTIILSCKIPSYAR